MNKTNVSISLIVTYIALAVVAIFSLVLGSIFVLENLWLILLVASIIGILFSVINKNDFIAQFKTFRRVDVIILIVFTLLLMITSILWDDNIFGIITTLTGILCVFQAARGSRWTFFWGAFNVFFYAIIAYGNNYAGDFTLNAFFYFPMQIIGIYFWNKNYNVTEHTVIKKVFKPIYYLYTVLAIFVGTFLIGYLMPMINGLLYMDSNPMPFLDSFTTTASIAAQVLMTKRFRQQWILWILINIGSIIMWIIIGDITMVIMWSAYLTNSIFGFIKWGE